MMQFITQRRTIRCKKPGFLWFHFNSRTNCNATVASTSNSFNYLSMIRSNQSKYILDSASPTIMPVANLIVTNCQDPSVNIPHPYCAQLGTYFQEIVNHKILINFRKPAMPSFICAGAQRESTPFRRGAASQHNISACTHSMV